MFVEAILPYYSFQMNLKKQQDKLLKELNSIDKNRVVFAPI